jgi:CubicO group peptidase (beta-lactamase class C family)
MQDFRPGDVEYLTRDHRTEKWMGNRSEHAAYIFSTSARDMARFGLLYLNRGRWNGEQILSEQWINKSWDPVNIEMYYTLKFGYMWWMFEGGTIYVNRDMGFEDTIYFTSGDGGHAIFVIPYLDLVVVHRVNEQGIDFWSQMKRGFLGMEAEVDDDDLYSLLREIRMAHPHHREPS